MATVATDPRRRATARAAFTVRRRRGALGDFPAGRVMTAEVALLAIGIAALVDNPVLRIVAGSVAVLLLVVVSARLGGYWWLTHLPRRAALRSRQQAAQDAMAAARRTGDPRLMALAAMAPGGAIREYRDRGGAIGIGQDEHGWYCALVVAPFSSLDGTRQAAFTLDRLARLFTETSVPVSRVQVVTCVLPAPTALIPANSPLTQSYRELIGADPVQADQAVWVALRLGPTDAADAAASRGGGLDGVDRALATSIARIGKALSEVDVTYRVLDGPELLEAVSCARRAGRARHRALAVLARQHAGPGLLRGDRVADRPAHRLPGRLRPAAGRAGQRGGTGQPGRQWTPDWRRLRKRRRR